MTEETLAAKDSKTAKRFPASGGSRIPGAAGLPSPFFSLLPRPVPCTSPFEHFGSKPGIVPPIPSFLGQRTFFLAVLLAILAAGCAAYAPLEAPAYGSAWKAFSAPALETAAPAPSPGLVAGSEAEWERAFEAAPEIRHAVQQARKAAVSASSRREVEGALQALDEATRQAQAAGHAGDGSWLRARLDALRGAVEAKILEIARIEPAFDVRKPGSVRVAVVKIGAGVETVRADERERWEAFLAGAGFRGGTVFLSEALAGAEASTAAVRAAAARLGADAVLAYTTFAAPTASPFGESAAVLSFAKAMLLDTRTEYLYCNAEGECREKRLGVPGFLCVRCLEADCVAGAIEGLRRELVHELERIREPERR